MRTRLSPRLCLWLQLMAVLGLSSQAAWAQDAICVRCTGPEATYRCTIVDGPAHATQGAQLLCITQLARQGHHDTCAVSRGTLKDCAGEERRVSSGPAAGPLPGAPPGIVATPAPGARTPPPSEAPHTARAPGTPDDPEPVRTVESLAKGSGEKLSKAGAALGEAARKSWNCMTSLFKSC